MSWNPITTAPFGALDMLLFFPNGRQAVGWRHSADYFLDSKAEPFGQEPTHWMPLPNPPWTDAQLLAAYNALVEDDQGPAAKAILAEIQRRNLDI